MTNDEMFPYTAEAFAGVYMAGALQAGRSKNDPMDLTVIARRAARYYYQVRYGGGSHLWALDEVFLMGYDEEKLRQLAP